MSREALPCLPPFDQDSSAYPGVGATDREFFAHVEVGEKRYAPAVAFHRSIVHTEGDRVRFGEDGGMR
jgi:hypothetical protein